MKIYLPPKYRGFNFDSTTPRAINTINEIGGKMITNISSETRKAINNQITLALQEGLGADKTADNIVNIIGLTDRDRKAVNNLNNRLIEEGISQTRVDKIRKDYAERLRVSRSRTIARTELMNSANAGHLEMALQGIEQGVIPSNQVYKEWIVTPDDRLCKYCAPMDGQEVKIDEPFVSALGSVYRPNLHINCRCVMSINIKD